LPSRVPPQPATSSPQTAVTAVARFALDSANPIPPNPSVRKRRSLREWDGGVTGLGSVRP
jgi:hypothetical protein